MPARGASAGPARRRGLPGASTRGFTLMELLAVVGIIAALAGMLMPSLVAAKGLTQRTVCGANIRLLQIANQVYARSHGDFYAPGAPHMFPVPGVREDPLLNMVRWYGMRDSLDEPFRREDGPLSPYLTSHLVKGCPSFTDFTEGFEAGCGGYGYNNNFVGQYVLPTKTGYRIANSSWHLTGNDVCQFPQPHDTVAFTDTALAARGGPMEYSFCESPSWPLFPRTRVQPSIHFRHMGRTNVVWLDGHVSDEKMTFSLPKGAKTPYGAHPAEYGIGWFGPRDNSLFDCR